MSNRACILQLIVQCKGAKQPWGLSQDIVLMTCILFLIYLSTNTDHDALPYSPSPLPNVEPLSGFTWKEMDPPYPFPMISHLTQPCPLSCGYHLWNYLSLLRIGGGISMNATVSPLTSFQLWQWMCWLQICWLLHHTTDFEHGKLVIPDDNVLLLFNTQRKG
jgi:hypothetical protein